jgi:hypothetical protein
MAIVQRNVEIKASPQEIMAQLGDASRWPGWYPRMAEIEIAAPFPDEGGNVAFKVKSAGMSMPVTETVLEYQPGKLQLLQIDGMMSGRARWELTPEGDGTRLTTTFDYALPGGVFGKMADALIVRRMNAKSLEEALHNFKALVERLGCLSPQALVCSGDEGDRHEDHYLHPGADVRVRHVVAREGFTTPHHHGEGEQSLKFPWPT